MSIKTQHTQEKPMRILWLSDSPLARTGFGVVAKNLIDNICKQMGKGIEIVVMGINEFSPKPEKYNSQTLVCDGRDSLDGVFGTYDPFCRGCFLDILKDDPIGYDGVVIINNIDIAATLVPEMKKLQAEKKKENKKSFKSFLYVPCDGYIGSKWVNEFIFFDAIATYTDYGKEMIISKNQILKNKIKVIPHGCNSNDYFPISKEEIKTFRDEFFGSNSDKFIFINVNRNQPRKAIHDTIFSFIEAKELWKESGITRKPFLYLHMGRIDPMGLDLPYVLEQTSLIEGEDYTISPDSFWNEKWGVETEVVNKIYNSCDAFITTTLGEGWGLSVTEAMAIGLPVICPYNTSLMEISGHGKRAHILTTQYPTCSKDDNIIREQVDIYEAGEVMVKAAQQRINGTDTEMIHAAQNYVKTLKWADIASRFVKIFEDTFKR